MNKFKAGPSEGVFDSSVVKDLSEAFEKADAHVNRSDSAGVPDTDRKDLARRIISEARTGETQPDLLWRSAVAKMLIEQKTDPIPEKREEIPGELHQDKPEPPHEPVKIPPAGPHATSENTTEEATPGAGTLPVGQTGGDG